LDGSALSELFMCTKCTKTYRLKHSLTRHIRFECGKEPMYACKFCPRRFKHKYDLSVHEKTKHLHVDAKKKNKTNLDTGDLAKVSPK
jgi:hypothetical protein